MRHFRLESILLYLHRISVFTQNLGQTHERRDSLYLSRRSAFSAVKVLLMRRLVYSPAQMVNSAQH